MELGTRCQTTRHAEPRSSVTGGGPHTLSRWPVVPGHPQAGGLALRSGVLVGGPLSVPLGEAQSPLRSRGASLTIVLTIISVRSGDRAWLSAPSCPAEPRPTALPELGRGHSGRRPWLHLSRMWTLKFGGAQDSSSQAPGGQCWVGLDADRGSEACRKRRSSGE